MKTLFLFLLNIIIDNKIFYSYYYYLSKILYYSPNINVFIYYREYFWKKKCGKKAQWVERLIAFLSESRYGTEFAWSFE